MKINFSFIRLSDLSRSSETSTAAKLRSTLSAYGTPIIQSAVSTVLGVSGLFLQPSYILNSFSQLLIVVITLGVLHGIVLLPVLLSLSNHKYVKSEHFYIFITQPFLFWFGRSQPKE